MARKMTRAELIASGAVKIGPRTRSRDDTAADPRNAFFTKGEHLAMTAEVPRWLKPVKAPHLMSYEERDRYLATQVTRWKSHEGMKAEERVSANDSQAALL